MIGPVPGRVLLRAAGGFLAGLAVWAALSAPYERLVAGVAEAVLRTAERPAVTRLSAKGGEIIVERSDFPPAAPRPGLPAAPFRAGRAAAALALLFAVHVVALSCQVESLYATRLGAWSEANYGVFARNAWAAAFHFYQIAGRFAAPFAIWWPLALGDRTDEKPVAKGPARRKKRRG